MRSWRTAGWLIKTDENGLEEWNTTFEDPDFIFHGYETQQSLDGGYILVGEAKPGADQASSFLFKTDSLGNELWHKIIGISTYDTSEVLLSIHETTDGGYIAAGHCVRDIWLVKLGDVPNVEITKPEDALYISNTKIRNYLFRNPLIIGPIDVEVDASDDEYEIVKVEFYVDEQLMETDTTKPYSWRWDKLSFFIHALKTVAYNSNGNVGIEEKTVWKFL